MAYKLQELELSTSTLQVFYKFSLGCIYFRRQKDWGAVGREQGGAAKYLSQGHVCYDALIFMRDAALQNVLKNTKILYLF